MGIYKKNLIFVCTLPFVFGGKALTGLRVSFLFILELGSNHNSFTIATKRIQKNEFLCFKS